MKSLRLLPVSLMLLAAALISSGPARANTVLYDSTDVIVGEGGDTQSFDISGPGTLTISVTSIPWLDVVADLNCFLSTTTGIMGKTMYGGGSESINVGAGAYSANWFGNAQGTYNEGVIGVKITFQPAVAAVSLPASLILLLSGLGLLFGWQPRRSQNLASLESIPSGR
jgi:hypothetical protein